MLNALRHQRKNHSLAINAPAPNSSSAQRLAASTEKPPIPFARLGLVQDRAKRLAASTEKPRKSGKKDDSKVQVVLNALRHQRKNHSLSRRDCIPIRFVLNALRHQRKNHTVTIPRMRISSRGCSTPCGINGKTTRGEGLDSSILVACSTPCGINGKTTVRDFHIEMLL